MPKAWQPLAGGRGKMSFTNLDATPGYGRLILVGRATSVADRSRVAEAEINRGVFRSRQRPDEI